MKRASVAISKTFKQVSHVIFDMDGLLLDTESINKTVISDIAKSYGKIYTPLIMSKLIGTKVEEASRIAVTEMQLPITPEEFREKFESNADSDSRAGSCRLMPGAERLVRHLHRNKVPIAIATSSSLTSFSVKTRKHQDLFSLFHHVVTGGSDPKVKKGKPSPDVFLVCASRFDESPPGVKCLVLEDAPNGVFAAIAAGMQVIMVPDPELDKDKTKDATLVLKSLEEIEPELFGLPSFN